jgi:hypothetical protein
MDERLLTLLECRVEMTARQGTQFGLNERPRRVTPTRAAERRVLLPHRRRVAEQGREPLHAPQRCQVTLQRSGVHRWHPQRQRAPDSRPAADCRNRFDSPAWGDGRPSLHQNATVAAGRIACGGNDNSTSNHCDFAEDPPATPPRTVAPDRRARRVAHDARFPRWRCSSGDSPARGAHRGTRARLPSLRK